MDFEFSPEQQAFADRGRGVPRRPRRPGRLRPHPGEHGPDRRHARSAGRSWRKLGEQGWLGITWPKEYGGSEGEGVYEYLLNEALAGRGGPQIGKGVGIIGKTLIAHGNDFLKEEFLPKILRNEVEFAVGYSEPNAGSDAASMRLKAERARAATARPGWILNGQKTWTTSAHFAEWYWLGTRTDPDDKHRGITLMLVPLDQPGITINGIWTMGDERTNEVFIDDVFVPDEYVVGEVNRGFQYISQALDLERFTMFTFSPIKQRLDLLVRLRAQRRARRRAAARRPGRPPARSPGSPPTPRSPACLGLRVVAGVDEGREGAGHAAADRRVVAVQALRHRVLAPARQRVDGPRRSGRAAAGARPRRRRWRAGPSRPTATP